MVGTLRLLAIVLALTGCGGPPRDIASIEVEASFADQEFLRGVAHAFYAQYPDRFDMLVIWGASGLGPTNSFYYAVRNDVRGIGYQHVGPEQFDRSGDFGSTRLQGIIWMAPDWRTNVGAGPRSALGILAQETGHRWGSSVYFRSPEAKAGSSDALLADSYHWSFFLHTDGSPLGGNRWQRTGEDTYEASPLDSIVFCPLDLYLMGLVSSDAVEPLTLLTNLRDELDRPSSAFTRVSPRVTQPVTIRVTAIDISIDRIIAAEGRRDVASGYSAREIRQAWIHVSQPGGPVASDLEKLAALQAEWSAVFARATAGLGRVITAL